MFAQFSFPVLLAAAIGMIGVWEQYLDEKQKKVMTLPLGTILSLYGSRVYGTAKPDADWDYAAVVPDNCGIVSGTEFRDGDKNIQVYIRQHFQEQLDLHKIVPLECYFHDENIRHQFHLNLDKTKLRHSLSEKASHSFVKAKKKIEVEHDFYVGWKSLFHALRILNFGIQIARDGAITDFAVANAHWVAIIESYRYDWEYFHDKYKPIFNALATEFRSLAPKD